MNRSTLNPRLLVIVNVFHPDRGGGAAVFSDMCYGLQERGYEVTVHCAYPYYPEWQDKSGKNGLRTQTYTDRGVRVKRHGLFIPTNPNSLTQRLLYEASFFGSLLRSLSQPQRFDAVMVFCPLVGAVGAAALRRWLFKEPLWLNIQDLSAEAAQASGISTSSFVNRLFTRLQRWLFNQADVWSSISPVMLDKLRPLRRREQPLLFVPNWLNDSLAQAINKLPDKTNRPPHTPLRLLYAGNIGTKQGLLRFCRKLQQSNIAFRFDIHGNGSQADRIKQWIEKSADSRFRFGPFLPEPEFAHALHETDYFVITEKKGSGGSFIPSKLIPGIASGTPILAVSDATSPLGQEMRKHTLGPWFPWKELANIPTRLQQSVQEPTTFMKWQKNALRRATFYERDSVLNSMDSALRKHIAKDSLTTLPHNRA